MPGDWSAQLRDNVARVRSAIAAACRHAGRLPSEVRLVGVTKYVAPEVLAALVAAGVADLGESRVQQLVARASACGPTRLDWPESPNVGDAVSPRWHMIGHLQRNKVRALLPYARILHSLDSQRLAAAVQQEAEALGVMVDAFIEVNVAGEATKEGVTPQTLTPLAAAVGKFTRVRLRGLMTMAPYDPDPETARPHFARLRELLDDLRARGVVAPECRHLSMGMSQDYAVAVEEGATFVRVGSALFDGLPSTDPRQG